MLEGEHKFFGSNFVECIIGKAEADDRDGFVDIVNDDGEDLDWKVHDVAKGTFWVLGGGPSLRIATGECAFSLFADKLRKIWPKGQSA